MIPRFVRLCGPNSSKWLREKCGPEYPAVSPYVLAVGGTSLNLTSAGNYSSETAWSGSGGGYSSFEPEPLFQQSKQTSGRRSNPDVAYNADPNTGVYVYESGSWWQYGGTSAGAPQWAGLVALVDQGRAAAGKAALSTGQVLNGLYGLTGTAYSSDLHDITSGSNGYRAKTGYDLATGLGSPRALSLITFLVNTSASANVAFKASTSSPASGTPHTHTNLFGTPVALPSMGSVQAVEVSAVARALTVTEGSSSMVAAANNAARPTGSDAAAAVFATPQFVATAVTGTEGPEASCELLPRPFAAPGTDGALAPTVVPASSFITPLFNGAAAGPVTAFAAPVLIANEDTVNFQQAAATLNQASDTEASDHWEAMLGVLSLALAGGCGNAVLRSEQEEQSDRVAV